MGQGPRSTESCRKDDHIRKEEHRREQTESLWRVLRMSNLVKLQSTTNHMIQRPQAHMPKLFGELRQRYMDRRCGYTRVLRIEPKKEDQAPSAILEFVDGPRDMKFLLTARTLAYRMRNNLPMNELTALNIKKVTQGRENGIEELRGLVAKMVAEPSKYMRDEEVEPSRSARDKQKVYPDPTRGDPWSEKLKKRDEKRRYDPLVVSRP
jgi:ribosomal protein L17